MLCCLVYAAILTAQRGAALHVEVARSLCPPLASTCHSSVQGVKHTRRLLRAQGLDPGSASQPGTPASCSSPLAPGSRSASPATRSTRGRHSRHSSLDWNAAGGGSAGGAAGAGPGSRGGEVAPESLICSVCGIMATSAVNLEVRRRWGTSLACACCPVFGPTALHAAQPFSAIVPRPTSILLLFRPTGPLPRAAASKECGALAGPGGRRCCRRLGCGGSLRAAWRAPAGRPLLQCSGSPQCWRGCCARRRRRAAALH